MPKGFRGTRVIETKICPICHKDFSQFKGLRRITCSMECGIKLRITKVLGTTREKIRDSKMNVREVLDRQKLRKELEAHLIDQLADSYDEGALV